MVQYVSNWKINLKTESRIMNHQLSIIEPEQPMLKRSESPDSSGLSRSRNPDLSRYDQSSLIITKYPTPPSTPEYPSASVETPPQISRFFAKQSQSPKSQNQHNPLSHKELHQYPAPLSAKKQTQSNPILSRRSPERSRIPRNTQYELYRPPPSISRRNLFFSI